MIGEDTKRFNAQEIISKCQGKFINILPHTTGRGTGVRSSRENLESMNTANRREEVKEMLEQLSLFLQLLIQNCVLTSNVRLRTEGIKLLGRFRNNLTHDLEQFQVLLTSRTKRKLPIYDVDCQPFLKRELHLHLPPQVSMYQDPLLFYIYSKPAQEQLFCNHSITLTRNQRVQILKGHIPFLNPLFIPVVAERLETKAKFSEFQDRLLLIMMSQKDKNKYAYFSQRPEGQIKNRIKNLCGNDRETINPIKEHRNQEYFPFKNSEIQQLGNAYFRYGTRWKVISKYYQIRTPQFLAAEYTQDVNLAKRREKQKKIKSYDSIKNILQEKAAKLKKNYKIETQMENQLYKEEENVKKLQSSKEPKYKIINNYTYIVEQI